MVKSYIAIDLKSFYASVECVERGLDPLKTNLVVADLNRTEKTICLAVTPSLKTYGISGRARLFEVMQRVKQINAERLRLSPKHSLDGKSCDADELAKHSELALDFIAAPPRMSFYMKYSTRIYQIYLRYFAPEDIHVYSIDEVFIDASNYLKVYKQTARELAMKIILEVLAETGITATAGIGTNLFLCKVAMDIEAKHIKPNANGVRIAELDESSFRRKLWSHKPITDFWRIGPGIAKRLAAKGIYTMGDIALCSVGSAEDYYNEDLLYELLGVNAELLIDHAWGWEPAAIADIKSYRPQSASLSSGQVLQVPYSSDKARLVVREMTDALSLDLVDKGLVTDQLVLQIGYDVENLLDSRRREKYGGTIARDRYGRQVPAHAHGSINLGGYTSSSRQLLKAVSELYDRIIDDSLLVRRMSIAANHLIYESQQPRETFEQLSLFVDYEAEQAAGQALSLELAREQQQQKAVISIKKRYGKNSILKGMNYREGATARDRNGQIGGHKA